jgi:hypothetical protein
MDHIGVLLGTISTTETRRISNSGLETMSRKKADRLSCPETIALAQRLRNPEESDHHGDEGNSAPELDDPEGEPLPRGQRVQANRSDQQSESAGVIAMPRAAIMPISSLFMRFLPFFMVASWSRCGAGRILLLSEESVSPVRIYVKYKVLP